MTRLITLCLLLPLFVSPLYGQEIPKPYEYSVTSAPAPETFFNFDITDSMYVQATAVHELIYKDQSATSWNSAVMDDLYNACTTFTYSGSIEYQPPSDLLDWYYRSENDTAVVSQSPKNSGDQFPVPEYLMADMGADAAGDVEGGGATNLDITHLYASYSDSKLYFRLDNNGGGFPTSGGLFTYYAYTVGIINPNTTDSTAYVLLYANVPLVFSPGLYALDLTDSSFTEIASITTNISGNSLSMSCNVSDLTAQPGWDTWPPEAGFIGATPVTGTVQITDLSYNDMGKVAVYIPLINQLDYAGANTAPVLTDQSVTCDDAGKVNAEIVYTDSEGNLPVTRLFYLEDSPNDLFACEKDYENGAVFSTELSVTESGWYKYYFEFSDGVETASTPLDSFLVDLSTFICGDVNDDEAINLADILELISCIYVEPLGEPEPQPVESGDVNSDELINLADILAVISHVYTEPLGEPELICP